MENSTPKGKVLEFKRQEKKEVTATGIELEADENIEIENPDELFLFYCPECEGTSFQMMGFADGSEDGGADCEVVKMLCQDCNTPVDGAFAWYVDEE